MGVLEQILSSLLIALLKYFHERKDIQDLVREKIRVSGLESANAALGWKADAVGSVDGGATLRVLDGALQITIPGYNPDVGSVTVTPPVQPGAHDTGVPRTPGQ